MLKKILCLLVMLFFIGCGGGGGGGSDPPIPVPPTPPPPPINQKLFPKFYNQKQQFLTFVSYFDAIRANQAGNLIKDLNYIRSKGIDGIRIMLNFNWYNYREIKNDHKNLFNPNGTLDKNKLAHLRNVLERAQERKLVVDISFISAPKGISEGNLRKGIITTIKQVRKWGYWNVIWDLANEHHKISQKMTIQLAKDMRNISKKYLYGISVAGGRSPETACHMSLGLEGCNILRYHDPRVPEWANRTLGLAIRAKKCAGNRPVYFDEPPRNGWGGQNYPASDFITACKNAKKVIAAWCFHTEAGFKLHKHSFSSQLSSEEKKAIVGVGKL